MSEQEKPWPATGAAPFPPVGQAESGQKLLQFLQRRLNLPPALLHRWIRTGQARLNGRRAKPFARVNLGDVVRLPPFAVTLAAQAGAPALDGRPAQPPDLVGASLHLPPLPPLVGAHGDIWAFHKPAGLTVQPGSGHEDSLASRLAAHAPGAGFAPTPAHRLDKDTSGILLVAATHSALRALHEAFRERLLIKEYVAWVAGAWPWHGPRSLRDFIAKEGAPGAERMRPCAPGPHAREALCVVAPLKTGPDKSLVQIRLITGRTHQIRVQLAALGHPVIGDGKYGSKRRDHCPGLRLHALRLVLPDGASFERLPDWTEPYAVDALPPPLNALAEEGAPDFAEISPTPSTLH